jgi:hypothetical protein
MGEKRNAYRVLVGKPEGKRAPRSSWHKWEDIEIYLKEIEWEVVYWIHLA